MLSYLTLLHEAAAFAPALELDGELIPPSVPSAAPAASAEWDAVWAQAAALGRARLDRGVRPAHASIHGLRPGSLAGVWEGVFMVRAPLLRPPSSGLT